MFEISASKITTYMDCPLKFRFRYVDRIEPEEMQPGLAFGSSFHRTVKFFYKRLMDGQRLDAEQIEQAFKEDWAVAQTVPISWNGESPEDLERQGIELLRAYIGADVDVDTPQAVETTFRIPLINLLTGEKQDDVELVGIIDRVNQDDEPVELKTAARSWNQLQADTSIQMTIYAYRLAILTGREQVAGRFEVMVKTKTPKLQILETARALRHFDQLYRTIVPVIRCIQDRRFFPKSGMFCGSCEYGFECLKW